jgi:mRNA-degrading endonuclease RelE of RelBE toxin-antitoxin system
MTYKLLRHKDFTAEWEKLPVAIRDQFKKTSQSHRAATYSKEYA